MSINVAIVENNAQVSSGLVQLIQTTQGLVFSGSHSNASSALHEFAESPPDVVLMEINLPGTNGIEELRRLRETCPSLLILVLTDLDDPQIVFVALSAGASGYLLKSSAPAQIIAAVRELHRGSSPITGSLARRLVNLFHQAAAPEPNYRSLSLREQQVLDRLAKGFRYKEIAGELQISYTTVHTHIRHIYKKLRVNSRTDAVTMHLRQYPHWPVLPARRNSHRLSGSTRWPAPELFHATSHANGSK